MAVPLPHDAAGHAGEDGAAPEAGTAPPETAVSIGIDPAKEAFPA
jgi:hypothetical protein